MKLLPTLRNINRYDGCSWYDQRQIGTEWEKTRLNKMLQACKEKELAEKADNFHQGVTAITVIADGGSSKRSHKHSYNAQSGLVIIIYFYTWVVLY